jgi:hypothetical protein
VRAGWKGGGFKPGRRGRRMRVAGWVAADAAALFVSNAGGWGRRRAGPARQPRLRWRRRSSSTVLRARCPLLLGVARVPPTNSALTLESPPWLFGLGFGICVAVGHHSGPRSVG